MATHMTDSVHAEAERAAMRTLSDILLNMMRSRFTHLDVVTHCGRQGHAADVLRDLELLVVLKRLTKESRVYETTPFGRSYVADDTSDDDTPVMISTPSPQSEHEHEQTPTCQC